MASKGSFPGSYRGAHSDAQDGAGQRRYPSSSSQSGHPEPLDEMSQFLAGAEEGGFEKGGGETGGAGLKAPRNQDDVGTAAPMFGTDYGFRPAGSARVQPPPQEVISDQAAPPHRSTAAPAIPAPAIPADPHYDMMEPYSADPYSEPALPYGEVGAGDPAFDAISQEDIALGLQPAPDLMPGLAADEMTSELRDEVDAAGFYDDESSPMGAPLLPAAALRKPVRSLATPVLPDHPNAAVQNRPGSLASLADPVVAPNVPTRSRAAPAAPPPRAASHLNPAPTPHYRAGERPRAETPGLDPSDVDLAGVDRATRNMDRELKKLEQEIAGIAQTKPRAKWAPSPASPSPASPPASARPVSEQGQASGPQTGAQPALQAALRTAAAPQPTPGSAQDPAPIPTKPGSASLTPLTSPSLDPQLDPVEVSRAAPRPANSPLFVRDDGVPVPFRTTREASTAPGLSPNGEAASPDDSQHWGQAPVSFIGQRGVQIASGLLGAALLVVLGFWAFSYVTSDQDISTVPRLIIADTAPLKSAAPIASNEDDDGAAKLVYDRVTAAEEAAQQRIVDSAEEPVGTVPVVRDIDVTRGVDAGIAARPVRTVIVRADGTIVETSSGSAGNQGAQNTQQGTAAPSQSFGAASPRTDLAVTGQPQVTDPALISPPAPGAELSQTGLALAAAPQAAAPQPVARPLAPDLDQQVAAAAPIAASGTSPATAAPAAAPIAAPAAAPVVVPAAVPGAASATGPTDLLNQAVQPAAAAVSASVAGPAATGGFIVQVSSQRSEADARLSAERIQRQYSDVVGTTGVLVQRADLGTRGIYYRARFGPMPREEATQVCSTLKSRGQDCFVQSNSQ